MKRAAILLLILGAVVAIGAGGHLALSSVAGGDGRLAEHARTTCAVCHGN